MVFRRWNILLKLFLQTQGRLIVAKPTSAATGERASMKEISAPAVEGTVGITTLTNCECAGRRWRAACGDLCCSELDLTTIPTMSSRACGWDVDLAPARLRGAVSVGHCYTASMPVVTSTVSLAAR